MTTYWFTVASGELYQRHAERLRRSLAAHEIELHVHSCDRIGRQAKHGKIEGILSVPREYQRIVYLDADTLVLDPGRLAQMTGSWRIPWRIPSEESVPKDVDVLRAVQRLESFFADYGLDTFRRGGSLQGVEWNSGVISGEREPMIALAHAWDCWWHRLLDLFDGRFRRDQVSYRLAYNEVLNGRDEDGLPPTYNWIVSYFGLNPNAHVLHRTMVRGVPWLETDWEALVAKRLAGIDVRTANRSFAVAPSKGRPDLSRRNDLEPGTQPELLRRTLALAMPKRVLVCGVLGLDSAHLEIVRTSTSQWSFTIALEALAPEILASFDFILFDGVDHRMWPEVRGCLSHGTVCCFVGFHDLSRYQDLHAFEHVRILAPGFGLFSTSAQICDWNFGPLDLEVGPEPRSSLDPSSTQDARVIAELAQRLGRPIRPLDESSDGNGYRMVDGRVVWLRLDSCRLEELPECIDWLSQIESLSLRDNRLKRLPESVCHLRRLRQLDVERNQLTALPETIGQLSCLAVLRANHNAMAVLPASLADLQALERLCLYDNRLQSIPAAVCRLRRLARLDLKKNAITSLPEELDGLRTLRDLNLWSNQLPCLPDALWRLNNLRVLNLRDNALSKLPAGIGMLTELRELYLDGNAFQTLPTELGALVRLEVLKLNRNQLDVLPESVGSLSSLRKLWLADNRLAQVPGSMRALASLEELDLQLNRLGDVPEVLGDLGSLRIVWLDRNPIGLKSMASNRTVAVLEAGGCRVSS